MLARRQRPHMADMEVIVRLQGQGAYRLDHRHDQALCEPEGRRAVVRREQRRVGWDQAAEAENAELCRANEMLKTAARRSARDLRCTIR